MVHTAPKITASFTFHGAEFKDVEVINPDGWFGKTWLMEIGGSYSPFFVVVEADSITDAIDELIDSKYGHQFILDEVDYPDYGVATDNPTCHFLGNNGRPCDIDDLLIHGDDRTGFPCLYHVEGWGAPVKPEKLSDVLEKMEGAAQCRERVTHPGKFEGCPAYVPYYWDTDADEDMYDSNDNLISRYVVTKEDRLMFPELSDVATVHLMETEQGFVIEVDAPKQETA